MKKTFTVAVRMTKKAQASKVAVSWGDVVHHAGDAATALSHGAAMAGSGISRAGKWISENPDAVTHAGIGAAALKAKQVAGAGLKRMGVAVRNKLTKKAQSTKQPDIGKLKSFVDSASKRAAGNASAASDILAKMKAAAPIKKIAFMAKIAEMAMSPGGISMAHGAKRLAQQAMALKNRVARKTPHLSNLPGAERFRAFAMENPGVVERSKKLHKTIAGTSGLAAAKAMSKKAGAWQRKEGKNPEGGLNAKGRASLRAQGQDIKRPVSSREAKSSPVAAARRKSFCARMSGMPGPMKDDKGRPTRKALSLRKWDC